MIDGLRPLERAQPNNQLGYENLQYGIPYVGQEEAPVIVFDQLTDIWGDEASVDPDLPGVPPFRLCFLEAEGVALRVESITLRDDGGAITGFEIHTWRLIDAGTLNLKDKPGRPYQLPFWNYSGAYNVDRLGHNFDGAHVPKWMHDADPDDPDDVDMGILAAFAWATSRGVFQFLGLNNIELAETVDDRPRRVRKRAKNRGIIYTVLAVRRGKTVYPISAIASPAVPTRLHIVRGHIKTYTEEAPLMGHVVGSYYWGPYLRGDETAGEVRKTYVLEASK